MALEPSGTPSMAAINDAIAEAAAQAVLDSLPLRGQVTVSIVASAQGDVEIDFPGGRFSVPPLVSVTGTGGANSRFYVSRATGVSADGMSVIVAHRDGTSTTADIVCDWLAFPANGDE